MDTELYLNDLIEVLKLPQEKLDARGRRELSNIAESWPYDSQPQQVARLARLFPQRPDGGVPGGYDAYDPACLAQATEVTTVLELAFRETSLKLLKKAFPRATVSTLSLHRSDLLVSSADLVIIPSSLHHMTAERRAALFDVFRQQAKFAAISLAIQEYDYRGGAWQYGLLDTLSNLHSGDLPLSFHPVSEQQLERELWQAGLALVKRGYPKGKERTYWSLYRSSDHLLDRQILAIPGSAWLLGMRSNERYFQLMREREKIDPRWRNFSIADAVLKPDAPELEYWEGTGASVETPSIKWGQLKLFAATLHILNLWNWGVAPAPTVVYAGAAEGWNVEILAEMFPSVTWHLYDWRKFDIAPNKQIHIHSGKMTGGDFNDEIARGYTPIGRNVLFLSDIRTDNAAAAVQRDMEQQARWVRIMNPRMSGLKFHPPYPVSGEADEFSYLPGYVVLQPFNGKASGETRLIVLGDQSLGDVVYSKKQYESQMFYHNMIIRSTPMYNNVSGGKVVYDDRELDNHYDSIYLLYALLQYIKLNQSRSTPLLLAREIIKKLSDKRKYPMIFKAERESGQREYVS